MSEKTSEVMEKIFEEQDLSILDAPTVKVYLEENGTERPVNVWPISALFVTKFIRAWLKVQDLWNSPEPAGKVMAFQQAPELLGAVALGLHANEKKVQVLPLAFIIWAAEAILEVSRIDFFIQHSQAIGERMGRITDEMAKRAKETKENPRKEEPVSQD